MIVPESSDPEMKWSALKYQFNFWKLYRLERRRESKPHTGHNNKLMSFKILKCQQWWSWKKMAAGKIGHVDKYLVDEIFKHCHGQLIHFPEVSCTDNFLRV